MSRRREEPILPYDPEIERTISANRRLQRAQQEQQTGEQMENPGQSNNPPQGTQSPVAGGHNQSQTSTDPGPSHRHGTSPAHDENPPDLPPGFEPPPQQMFYPPNQSQPFPPPPYDQNLPQQPPYQPYYPPPAWTHYVNPTYAGAYYPPQQPFPPQNQEPPRPQYMNQPPPQVNQVNAPPAQHANRAADCVYERTRPRVDQYLAPPDINANEFELRPALITMIQNNQFAGRPQEDPHTHLKVFLKTSNTIKYRNVAPDQVRVSLFPFSLRDQALTWYESLTEEQQGNWQTLVTKFLEEYFPETKVMDYQYQISRFKMKDDEDLGDAWKRFTTLIRKCPQHGFPQWQLVQYFYRSAPRAGQSYMDARASEDVRLMPSEAAWALFEKMAASNATWKQDANQSRDEIPHRTPKDDEIDELKKKLADMSKHRNEATNAVVATEASNSSEQTNVPRKCELCHARHYTNECHLLNGEPAEVNYMGNQGAQQQQQQ